MATFKISLLDPQDWEKLVDEKEWKLATKSERLAAFAPRPNTSLFSETALGRTVSGLIDASTRTAQSIVQYAARKAAEYQAESSLRSLLRNHNERYADDLRHGLLQLHSVALKQNYSINTRVKILEAQLRCLIRVLDARPSQVPIFIYKDLLEILSIVCSGEYPSNLVQQAWDVFLNEMRTEGARQVAIALVELDVGDTHLILRHLAVCHISAWKTLPTGPSVKSEPDARLAARKTSFAWDTYDGYLKTTNGFYALLSGVLEERPSLVHAAFDDSRLYLLWLKFIPSTEQTIDFVRVTETVAPTYWTFPKRVNIELPTELECLLHFITTKPDPTLLESAVEYLRKTITAFAAAEPELDVIAPIYRVHPSLQAGQLAHPTLPALLFSVHLLLESPLAAEKMTDSGIIKALCNMWNLDFEFTNPTDYRTGRWVLPEKKISAMRIATSLVLGGLASHKPLYSSLSSKFVGSDEEKQWFWRIASYALTVRVHHANASWLPTVAKVKDLATYVMQNHNALPGDTDRDVAMDNDAHLIWMLHSSGQELIDSRLRTFALDVLIRRVTYSAATWAEAVSILSSCKAEEMQSLTSALSEFINHFISSAYVLNARLPTAQGASLDAHAPANRRQFASPSKPNAQTPVMSNILDRFVMLISNASRKNRYVHHALEESDILNLISLLLAGHFDTDDIDHSSKAWRQRTCEEIITQRASRLG